MKTYLETPLNFACLRAIATATALVATAAAAGASEPSGDAKARAAASLSAAVPPAESKSGFRFSDLLPTAFQKRPQIRFNVYTEMTPEGRSRPEPSPAKPLTYFAPEGKYAEVGWQIVAGEKPPPWEQLRAAMQQALADNGYNPITGDRERPDLLIVFSFGSFSTDLASIAVNPPPGTPEKPAYEPVFPPPLSAEELVYWLVVGPPDNPFYDRKAVADVIERARFIGGTRVAEELRDALRFEATYVGPPEGSPVNILLRGAGGPKMSEVLELAFHTCYFVTATAYDFSGVEKKQRQILWQTRMTVGAQGVAMGEVLKPLIINTGAFIGRETPETVFIDKRINRDVRVEVGEAVVVPEGRPAPEAQSSGAKK